MEISVCSISAVTSSEENSPDSSNDVRKLSTIELKTTSEVDRVSVEAPPEEEFNGLQAVTLIKLNTQTQVE
jgi:hypothetical protein